jgi:serine/threonine-protein kinase
LPNEEGHDAPPTRDSGTLEGTRVGPYQVLGLLSQGGMGAVYRGIEPVISRPVAIKVLLPEVAKDEEMAHRLLAEARAVNAIQHPNIVDIFDFGTLPDGRHYFVMELLAGQSLSQLINARGRLTVSDAMTVLEQVMGALAAIHGVGVVHRDLKPSNLFVTWLPEGMLVKVLDFGVAKGTRVPLANVATLPGSVLGTPGYLAPEQIRGLPSGPPADIYAMGAVTFRMLTGRDPLRARSEIDLLKAHLDQPVPTLRSCGIDADARLEELVENMLRKDAATRPDAHQIRRWAARLKLWKAADPG